MYGSKGKASRASLPFIPFIQKGSVAGINPYIAKPEAKSAQKSFKVRFLPMNLTVMVEPAKLKHQLGLPGSLLDLAESYGIAIDHSCGGVCACSTCHVIVREGLKTCSEATEDEEDMLDLAPGLEPQSRLACQCVPDGNTDLVVEIPAWNRNLVKEGTH